MAASNVLLGTFRTLSHSAERCRPERGEFLGAVSQRKVRHLPWEPGLPWLRIPPHPFEAVSPLPLSTVARGCLFGPGTATRLALLPVRANPEDSAKKA